MPKTNDNLLSAFFITLMLGACQHTSLPGVTQTPANTVVQETSIQPANQEALILSSRVLRSGALYTSSTHLLPSSKGGTLKVMQIPLSKDPAFPQALVPVPKGGTLNQGLLPTSKGGTLNRLQGHVITGPQIGGFRLLNAEIPAPFYVHLYHTGTQKVLASIELGPEQFFAFDGIPNDPQLLLIAIQPATNIELRARVNSEAFTHHAELIQDINLNSTATDLLLRAWNIDTYQPISAEDKATLKSQLPLFMQHLKRHLNDSWKKITAHPAYDAGPNQNPPAQGKVGNSQNNNSSSNAGNGQNNDNNLAEISPEQDTAESAQEPTGSENSGLETPAVPVENPADDSVITEDSTAEPPAETDVVQHSSKQSEETPKPPTATPEHPAGKTKQQTL